MLKRSRHAYWISRFATAPGGIRWLFGFLAIVLCCSGVLADSDEEFFEAKIRPLLIARCSGCHSAEKGKTQGGLALDSQPGWQHGGESGPAMIPGNVDESLLIRAVLYGDDGPQMPPEDAGGKLPDTEIALLKEWVKRGAYDPRVTVVRRGGLTEEELRAWWSFQPLHRSQDANPSIDAFVLARLKSEGLTTSPEADRRTLIRRATYDLIGLPPTAEEVDGFLANESPTAYESLVDRLLQSPHYGERWGRHWLDVVRYADTAGENTDHPIPDAWRYRNWVIDAFNRDLPYDQFVREQIAGDLLHANDPAADYAEGIVATGFLAIARRFDHDSDKHMHLTFEDTIDTLGKTFLGLSIACARCHDHKYDPISAKDYYAIYGILNSTRFAFPGCEAKQQPRDLIPLLPPAEWAKTVEPYDRQLAAIDAELTRLAETGIRKTQLMAQRDELVARAPVREFAYAVAEGTIANAKLHLRGDPEKPGEEVPRRWLELLGGQELPADAGSGRLQLAEWLTDPTNPLVARVMVNRIWQHHFVKGLVQTPNDFGTRGQRPTHPELLDWLAGRFIESGWSVKSMHRLMMLSATYRQSTGDVSDEGHRKAIAIDPNNTLYWRFDRRRLSAEELRDSLLVASQQIDLSSGGPHPIPPTSSWSYSQHVPFAGVAETNNRSVYLMTLRNRRQPFMGLFDGADANATTPQRQVTTVPTQALYFLNDSFFHEQAGQVAERILNQPDDETRLNELFRIVLQRLPSERERETAMTFLSQYLLAIADIPAADQTRTAWSAYARILLSSNEFLYLD